MYRKHKQRNQRAITDMTASYTRLRDLDTVPEEVSVVFMTEDKKEYTGTICVGYDHNDVLCVTLWVCDSIVGSGLDTTLQHVVFRAENCLWCRYNEMDVLFWKRPVLITDVSLRLRFESYVDARNFMRRVVR